MSRTEEDIASRVDITIMRDTTLSTYPASYSEVCDTFRPRLACARRTDSGRERFIDFLVPSPVRSRFVAEHVSEGRPASIQDRLRQVGLGESGGVHITNRDIVELSNDAGRELVVKITARVANARVNVSNLRALTSPLRGGEFIGQLPQKLRVLDFFAVRQGSEIFEAQVNPNAGSHRPRLGLRDLYDDVQEPVPACIAGEVCAVLDLAFGQRTRVKHPKGMSGEPKGLPLAPEVAAFQRHPTQRAPAPPPQERPVLLTAGLGVLLAHGVNRACVQKQLLTAPRGQPIEVKAGWPALVPFERLQLSLVAEIPDEIAGARLAVEQPGQRFDAVSLDQQHQRKLMRLRDLGKTSKLAETSIFTRHFLKHAKSSARSGGAACALRSSTSSLARARGFPCRRAYES
jgi:hypothetical protein